MHFSPFMHGPSVGIEFAKASHDVGSPGQRRESPVPPDVGVEGTLTGDAPPSDVDENASARTQAHAAYDIRGEHARGGLGRVLQAEDRRLGRIVAIKELLRQGTEASRRFLREVQLTARLQHPGVVPIYEAGQWPNGTPFYAMKFIEGRTLKDVLRASDTLAERLALLPKLIAIAETIAYAHSENVIHRDLKPANVLIGRFGETVIVDWGLAKELDAPSSSSTSDAYRQLAAEHTVEGAVIGTPVYMPPEQARGQDATTQSDVYALGAIMYELLAGEPPYRGANGAEVLSQVLSSAPPRLVQRVPGAPRELVAVAEKAMARNPQDRYANASELAEDLVRFQAGRLVRAHEYSRAALVSRWIARNRRAISVGIAALVTMAILSVVGVRRIIRERGRAEARGNEMLLLQAQAQLDRDPTAAVAWAKTYPTSGTDRAGLSALVADAESRGVARHIFRRSRSLMTFVALSHDGKRLATEADANTLRISDIETGRALATIRHGGTSIVIAWTDDDRALVVTNWLDGVSAPLEFIDVASSAITQIGTVTENVASVSVHGEWAVLSGNEREVQLWNLSTHTVRTIAKYDGIVPKVLFSPDGSKIVSTGGGKVGIFDRATERTAFFDAGGIVLDFVFDASAHLMLARRDGSIVALDPAAGATKILGHHEGAAGGMSVSRDGHWLATASIDRTVRLWDLVNGGSKLLAGHATPVCETVFAPQAPIIVSGGTDGTIHIWNRDSGAAIVWTGHTRAVQYLAFSPDGHYLVSTAEDKTSRVWDMTPVSSTIHLLGHQHRAVSVAQSPDGQRIVSSSADKHVRIWSTSGDLLVTQEIGKAASLVAFSPDGARLAAATGDDLMLLNAANGARLGHFPLAAVIWAFQFSPGGSLGVACTDGILRIWTGSRLQTFSTNGDPLRTVAFSPDGEEVAAAGDSGAVYVWNLGSGTEHVDNRHYGRVEDIAYSPDGTWLASASVDRHVVLRGKRNDEIRIFTTDNKLIDVAFSPSSKRMAAAGHDGAIFLWNLDSVSEQRLVSGEAIPVSLRFSPDERWLMSAAEDGTVRIWSCTNGELRRMYRVATSIADAILSADGTSIIAACTDGVVRRWPMPLGTAPYVRGRLEALSTATVRPTQILQTP